MSSKNGPHVSGTDGRDYLHREKIATHYKSSVVNKWRLKLVTSLHIGLLLLMLLRLSTPLLVMFSIRPPAALQRLRLPAARVWEYAWLCSVLPAILAPLALVRNRVQLMRLYIVGIAIFGAVPVSYAAVDLVDDVTAYWQTKEAALLFLGFPVAVLWGMFAAIALQVHFFGVYFAWLLLQAWGTTTTTTTTSRKQR